jgi:PST family polysaccharide transporter
MSDSLSLRAGRALGVNVLNTLAFKLGTFAIGVALARILGPEEFGTFAVAQLALFAVLSFYELGVSLAIVRWPEPPDRITPTVATISTASSAIIFALAFIAAPWFSSAMGAPQATEVVRLLAVNVVIAGIVATPAALMQREFQAGRRMLIDQVNSWLGAVVSIGFAIGGMGAMSLAVGRITGALVGGALFLYFTPFRFGFDREIAQRLLSFGLPLAGSSIVVFGVTYIDQVLVGAVLGPIALGFYVLAFNLSSWPVNVFSQPVRQVSPAAFARLQGDPPALRSAFVSSARLLTAATLPICLVLTGAAAPIVNVVYGETWSPAAAALWCLGLLAALRIFFELVYDYFVVVGDTRVVFTVQVVWLIALAPALYAGARLAGIEGAGAAQVVVAVLVVLPLYLLRLNRNGIDWRRLASGVALPMVFGLGVVVVALAAHRLIPFDVVAIGVAGIAVLAALALEARSMWPTVQRLRTVLDTGGA